MFIHVKKCLFTCLLFTAVSGCTEKNRELYEQLAQENSRLTTQLDSLRMHLDSQLNVRDSALIAGNYSDLLNKSDLSYLEAKGLKNPVAAIKADLIRNNSLISVQGSLGGTMQFYKERIHILNRKWVLAYFEDGHNAGEMLLEFTVDSNGTISWKSLTTSLM
jgi:hypothetical protein